ncbi:hypothetical protein KOAAANKH_02565 [Brevundimonas sp. NIBR10]|uniref:hypothetical protein n=1 Tax=Brevundimonas sp. NIBR10 TaxID=3015997 RepID=UPI0022F1D9E9|nr:hypothetical protein [Brevundimonas sp. NIBR10]WGM47683.1 hypothetical protein KOAAANKH_02565 [Brevundimonas sp. NIBR10]
MSPTTTDSEPTHISAVMPLVVRNIADAAVRHHGDPDHPNRVKMRAFVERNIANARKMHPAVAVEHLRACIAQTEANWLDAAKDTASKPGNAGLMWADFELALLDFQNAMVEVTSARVPA